ncbi:MAG: hypothetical protein KC561_03025, partial [Myxococcales bacterium]|nr:hypothetical protein [Myxococcales bacterium]
LDPENRHPVFVEPSLPMSEDDDSSLFANRSWFTGRYGGRLFYDTRNELPNEDVFLLQNRLELRAKLDFSENWTAVVEGRLEHRLWGQGDPDEPNLIVNGDHYSGVFEPCLRDAYVSGRFGSFFLTVGNQSVVWGAGTLSRPADVINPQDYRNGTLDTPGDQRIPVFAVEGNYVFERMALSVVVIPFFEPHAFDVIGTDFAISRALMRGEGDAALVDSLDQFLDPSIQPRLNEGLGLTNFPDALPGNISAGTRLTGTFGGVDLGLGYFFGWERIPFIYVDPELAELFSLILEDEEFMQDYDFFGLIGRNPEILGLQESLSERAASGETLLVSEYRRQHTVEADMATYLGQLGIRAEVAYNPQRTVILADFSSIRRPALSAALALTYEKSENFALHLEGFWSHLFDMPEAEATALSSEDNYGAIGFIQFGLAEIDGLARSRWGDLGFRFGGLWNASSKDFILYPSISFAVSDVVDIGLGAMFFFGPELSEELTIGGLYDANDQVFFSVDAVF